MSRLDRVGAPKPQKKVILILFTTDELALLTQAVRIKQTYRATFIRAAALDAAEAVISSDGDTR